MTYLEPSLTRPKATPATGSVIGTPASINAKVAAQTEASLNLSRSRLLSFIDVRLMRTLREDSQLLALPFLKRDLARIDGALAALSKVSPMRILQV